MTISKFFPETEHAKLSPSSASRWSMCPGSVLLCEQVPEPDTKNPYAMLGILAHSIAQFALAENKTPHQIYFENKEEIDNLNLDFDPEAFLSNIHEYIFYINSHASQEDICYLEHRIDLSKVIPECFGTVDFFSYNEKTKHCQIFDLKMGSQFVSADRNLQLSLYAAGIQASMHPDIEFFTFHIVQPVIKNTRTWVISLDGLMEIVEPLQKIAEEALSENADLNPDKDACKYCRAKGICSAFQEIFNSIIELEGIEKLSTERKVQILDLEPSILNYIKQIKQDLLQQAIDGEEIPGWEVGKKRTLAKWKDEAEDRLVELIGEEAFQKKLISIKEAKALIPAEEIHLLTYNPDGEAALVKKKK